MKEVLIGFVVIVGLFGGCAYMSKRDILNTEQLNALIDQCADLNGTLRGERVQKGDDMGKWRRSSMFCDFNTPPAPRKPAETFESGTVYE